MSELYDILVETPPTKVILLALDQGLWDCERSLAELAALCEANHMEAVAEVTQKRQTPETGIVLGSGKLEDCIYDLISQCEEVLSDKPLFFAVNSYTTGLSPAVMEYMLKTTLIPRFGGKTSCDEIGLPVSATGGVVPCGATAIWEE